MKAGIVEIGDIFVVNKADRPGADRTVASLESAVRLGVESSDAWVPSVFPTVATDGTGVAAVVDAVIRFRAEHSDAVEDRRRQRAAASTAGSRAAARLDHVAVAVSDPEPLMA